MADIVIDHVIDNSDEFKRAMKAGVEAALEAIGQQAVSHAKHIITTESRVDSGELRNTTSYRVVKKESTVYIGNPLEYAIYNEYGTGIYGEEKASNGWWVYVAGSKSGNGKHSGKRYTRAEAARIVARMRAEGLDAHMTQGMKGIHFIRDAVKDHITEYETIAKNEIMKKLP